ncbi:MAG: hypothetical protein HY671_02545 [Chloroflexi bacterium]|nr:hypothetical protein [Chloroflexota bacterium]
MSILYPAASVKASGQRTGIETEAETEAETEIEMEMEAQIDGDGLRKGYEDRPPGFALAPFTDYLFSHDLL